MYVDISNTDGTLLKRTNREIKVLHEIFAFHSKLI